VISISVSKINRADIITKVFQKERMEICYYFFSLDAHNADIIDVDI
jgi:hypothetical protein